MAYEHKNGSFSLFKNDKGDNEKRPDYRGTGKDLAGQSIEVAAWLRDGKDGGPRWLSCTIKVKEAQPAAPAPKQEQQPNPFDDLNDPPF